MAEINYNILDTDDGFINDRIINIFRENNEVSFMRDIMPIIEEKFVGEVINVNTESRMNFFMDQIMKLACINVPGYFTPIFRCGSRNTRMSVEDFVFKRL